MTGFLNVHGTSMALYGHFISLSCETDDDVAALENAGLITFPDVDREVFEDELDDERNDILYCELIKLNNTGRADLMKCPYWDFGVESEPVQYSDIKEWYYATMSDEEAERLAAEAEVEMAAEQLERELKEADVFMPSFSSNRDKRLLTYLEAEDHWFRSNFWNGRNRSKKQAKFRIDGKRGRKDNRDHRIGNRQKCAELRDYWADDHSMWEEFFLEENPAAIPTFGIEIVGLTDEEASRHESEFDREAMNDWLDWSKSDSNAFDPITNATTNKKIWEQHLFPERFQDYRPYRYSSQDYWDDFGLDLFEPDWYYGPEHDDPQEENHHFDGPTLEEWLELDAIAFEQMLEEEVDRFAPSFTGSKRSNLRYHISEPRRGKLKRKYGKSTSYFYRGGRPYTATAAVH
jgi:hypothetical protein